MVTYMTEKARNKAEKAELKRAKEKIKAQQQPILRPIRVKPLSQTETVYEPVERARPVRRKKRRKARSYYRRSPVSTRVAKSIRKAEKQATGIFRQSPPNIVGLRKRPSLPKRQKSPRKIVSESLADKQDSRRIIDEFLS